jgi:hypothetical protein
VTEHEIHFTHVAGHAGHAAADLEPVAVAAARDVA